MRRPRRPSAEEAALFHAAVGDAKPIKGRARKKAVPPPSPAVPAETKASARPGPAAKTGAPPPARPPALAPLAPDAAPAGVDARSLERLKRGRKRPEARIDLHGRTLAEAHALLARFLVRAAADGTRTVLVITGHGARRDGGSALRRELPHWLNAPDLRPLVLALVPAAPQDGGAGAFYVLLKRRRAPTG